MSPASLEEKSEDGLQVQGHEEELGEDACEVDDGSQSGSREHAVCGEKTRRQNSLVVRHTAFKDHKKNGKNNPAREGPDRPVTAAYFSEASHGEKHAEPVEHDANPVRTLPRVRQAHGIAHGDKGKGQSEGAHCCENPENALPPEVEIGQTAHAGAKRAPEENHADIPAHGETAFFRGKGQAQDGIVGGEDHGAAEALQSP